jgi:hypothetical protein
MNPQDLRNLQESYLEIYEDSLIHTNPNRLAQKMGARLKREIKRSPDQKDKKTKQYLDTIETLRRRASSGAEPSKYFGRGYAMGVRKENLEFILDYLLDEGYTTSIEGAEVILENMSEGWMESIFEAFVDPETGEAPSGRSPVENVSYHPKKSVRKKAMRAFAKQMRKEYGGNWKAKTEDPTRDS